MKLQAAAALLIFAVHLNAMARAVCSEIFPRYVTLVLHPSERADDAAGGVHYMSSAAERDPHRLRFDERGRLTWSDGSLLQVPLGKAKIFVMDGFGDIYAFDLREPRRGALHHTTFLAGGPVAAAGMLLHVEDGILFKVSNRSGHYAPPGGLLSQLRESLDANGAAIKQIQYVDHSDEILDVETLRGDLARIKDRNKAALRDEQFGW